ncbi:OsmC family protein [Laribacter hongkongensis]|uniref:Osmotically inducible protein C n=1 Tax=Laribacter hongkongensis TaxID=168471 RepID=A0A248LL87_9NEIS|nr:OsmC family protein [Laribacter hongkongensis]ASJ25269.1 osmotically inducible protein C [Laribacter hongkongensis]MCG9040670.1 OsmC family protein [Laribacter hongkongensis]MCG9066996.1 OsmC family protein [Laribacter hongkongensis]MCG9088398.1 OsmC family protein [Laribacter hongkongensis]MCG9108969.1 OsmC family protein [Laribacter hongkongensis]
MKARLKQIEGSRFLGESESGHGVVIDPEKRFGASPMELVLMGAAGCSSYDVVSILKKGRQDVRDVTVEMDADRADTEPKVFTRIHFRFIVTGRQLKPELVERAISLSSEKYCSASIMLGKTAVITHDFSLIEVE